MRELTLSPAQRRQLECQLQETRDAGVFRRTLAVLEVANGRSVIEIARLLRISRPSIYQWLADYGTTHAPESLADHRGGNRPTVWTPERQAVLEASMAQPPDHFGYPAVEWTVPLLREHLARTGAASPSAASIRRQLRDLGYVWKRPRYVLDPDRDREKKDSYQARDPALAAGVGAALRG
jgi:transposase